MAAVPAHTQALELLAAGRYAEAQDAFGALVEGAPTDVDFAAGFHASGWWNNRSDVRQRQRAGRALADWLMREWDEYDELARNSGYNRAPAYQAAMHAALRDAADNFRIAFQEEGAGSVDVEMLRTLAVCLIRLEEYNDSIDILNYALRKKGPDARLYFLLGEAWLSRGDSEGLARGLSYYRDAFFLDHRAIDATIIDARPAAETLRQTLKEKNGDWDSLVEWLPARLMAYAFVGGLRRLSEREVRSLHAEVERLERDLNVVIERYRDRVRARLCYLYLVLIQFYTLQEKDRDIVEDFEDRLRSLSPESYDFYRSVSRATN